MERSIILSVEPDLENNSFDYSGSSIQPGVVLPRLDDKAWALRNIRADKAWALVPPMFDLTHQGQQDGRGIRVAHLDTGWTDHVDLDSANFDPPGNGIKDFINPIGNASDPLKYTGQPGHGTSTGSVIMSRGGVNTPYGTNAPGEITGVARCAVYVPMRCIQTVALIPWIGRWSRLSYFNSHIAQAVHHATGTGCDVVSMSLGGFPLKGLHAAIRNAVNSHLLLVCAAGNKVRITVWPARYKESIAVAASNIDDEYWFSSSGGLVVDISAPGEDVWKADPDVARVQVSKGSGTSYATAHVAGCAALWLAFFDKSQLVDCANINSWQLQEIFRQKLIATARAWPHTWQTDLYGAGIVDAEQLLMVVPPVILAAADRLPPNLRGQPDSNDLLGLSIEYAKKLLAEKLAREHHASIQAFEHELATIFLNEANERTIENLPAMPANILPIIKKHGSRTLKAALNLK